MGGSLAHVMRVNRSVVEAIMQTVASQRPETGGWLGGPLEFGAVTRFHFDNDGDRTARSYAPNLVRMSDIIDDRWKADGVGLVGFVHSHPSYARRPSFADLQFALGLFRLVPHLSQVWLPIVLTKPTFELVPFLVRKTGERACLEPSDLVILKGE